MNELPDHVRNHSPEKTIQLSKYQFRKTILYFNFLGSFIEMEINPIFLQNLININIVILFFVISKMLLNCKLQCCYWWCCCAKCWTKKISNDLFITCILFATLCVKNFTVYWKTRKFGDNHFPFPFSPTYIHIEHNKKTNRKENNVESEMTIHSFAEIRLQSSNRYRYFSVFVCTPK